MSGMAGFSGAVAASIPVALSRCRSGYENRKDVSAQTTADAERLEALAERRCNRCRRGCSLASPKCRRGKKLQAAILEGREGQSL